MGGCVMGADDRPPLFEWQETLALAAARKLLKPPEFGIALFVALTASGTSGEGACIDAARIALEVDLSERQVWRHWHKLRDLGWFEQTSKPIRTGSGHGKRARYRLTLPPLDLSLGGLPDRVTEEPAVMSQGGGSPSDTFDTDRLTLSDSPSDIAEREHGTVLPSDGLPSDGYPSVVTAVCTEEDAREHDHDESKSDQVAPGRAAFQAERERMPRSSKDATR